MPFIHWKYQLKSLSDIAQWRCTKNEIRFNWINLFVLRYRVLCSFLRLTVGFSIQKNPYAQMTHRSILAWENGFCYTFFQRFNDLDPGRPSSISTHKDVNPMELNAVMRNWYSDTTNCNKLFINKTASELSAIREVKPLSKLIAEEFWNNKSLKREHCIIYTHSIDCHVGAGGKMKTTAGS